MKIAIASGKGGTGKTLVATNLGHVASDSHLVNLYDLDVEEPNCHLFFPSRQYDDTSVKMMIPSVDQEKCGFCGTCSEVCEYHAIIAMPGNVVVFPELCHSCYGCLEMCPERAISEGYKDIGRIRKSAGESSRLGLIYGELKIGQPATTALVRRTKAMDAIPATIDIYDSPPGTSCPVVEAMKEADYVILVSEPTPFGLHDLDLIAQTATLLKKRVGVVVNKSVDDNFLIEDYCQKKNIEIIQHIPYREDIARAYARGDLVVESLPDLRVLFEGILQRVLMETKRVSA
jgi:MinD superfamily P-loop ATPase